MPNQKTNQLKLYTEQEISVYANGDGDVIERLCSAFTQLTGYRLTFDPHLDRELPDKIVQEHVRFPVPDGKRPIASTLELSVEPENDAHPIGEGAFESCRHFAETISELVTRLQVTRASLRDREGELAAAVPLVCDPDVDRHQVADRLEAVLSAGVTAVGMTSAALFILDDFTQHLKLRAHWGLSDDRFAAPPRVLKTATADLEALVGHAVVLDKPTSFASWNAPESFGSAVCVPVSTATVPLGTLWFFDESPRKYDDAEVGVIEVIAGRIAAELEREILLRSKLDGHAPEESVAQDWSRLAWPSMAAPSGWQVTCVPNEEQSLPNGCFFHHRQDSRLNTALVTVHEEGLRGGMLTAGMVGATSSQIVSLSPAELAAHLDEAAAQVSFEQRPTSNWCCSLDTETGELEYCQSGAIEAFVIRPHAWEILGDIRLASDSDPCKTLQTQLEPGDALMIVAGTRRDDPNPQDEVEDDPDELINGPHLAELILRHAHQTTEESARVLKSLLGRHRHVWQSQPNFLLIQRDPD